MDAQKEVAGSNAKNTATNSIADEGSASVVRDETSSPAKDQPMIQSAASKSGTVDFEFNILLLGDSGVGKTTLIARETQQNSTSSTSTASTIGVQFHEKLYQLDVGVKKRSVLVRYWDAPGAPMFSDFTVRYAHGSAACVLIFDTADMESFLSIDEWMSKVKKCQVDQVLTILIGNNKGDGKSRAVTKDQAQSFADKHSCKYLEVNALDGTGVSDAFLECIRTVLEPVGEVPDASQTLNFNIKLGQHLLTDPEYARALFGDANSIR